jgi:purine-binding chemotaxis protein CheW
MTKKKKSQEIIEVIEAKQNETALIDVNIASIKLVIFTLPNGYYAFGGESIKEILPAVKINGVPGVPDFILGVINVRGDIESVIDINSFLGLPEQETNNSKNIIIAEGAGVRSGILVNSVEDVMDFPEDSIQPPLASLNDKIKQFVIGETEYKEQSVTVLNAKEIFKNISTN